MSYSWVGSPAPFNGTNEETGGDSGEHSRFDLQRRVHYTIGRLTIEKPLKI